MYLDLSFNAIEELEPEAEFPTSLHVLRWNSNPFLRKPVEGNLSGRELYRRRVILHCLELAELDKYPLLPVERLKYQGLLPPALHAQVDMQIARANKRAKELETRERVDEELNREVARDQGKTEK